MAIKRAAVIPAQGLGDALMMMVASHQLQLAGYEVVTFQPKFQELSDWFSGHWFASLPRGGNWAELLSSFDLIVAQNDNSALMSRLRELRAKGQIPPLAIFYPIYKKREHGTLYALDRIFCPTLSMVENIARAVASLVGRGGVSKDNGLTLPQSPLPRAFKKRIVIHPTSGSPLKNWPAEKFILLAEKLLASGWQPVLVLREDELLSWRPLVPDEIAIVTFPSLSELATFICESAFLIGNDSFLGHLASNLHIPHLIIADNRKRMRMWRPGWLSGGVLTPPIWVPNWKPWRLRQRKWHKFISVASAYAAATAAAER